MERHIRKMEFHISKVSWVPGVSVGVGQCWSQDAPSEEGAGVWVPSGWRKSRRSSNGRETGPWEA